MLYDVFIGDVHIGQVRAEPWTQVVIAPGRCALVLRLTEIDGEKKIYKPVF